MILNVNDVLTLYKEEHGMSLESNKQMHRRLKYMKRSLSEDWEKQMEQVSIDIGNGRTIKINRFPDIYWQLHVYSLRKDIIGTIKAQVAN